MNDCIFQLLGTHVGVSTELSHVGLDSIAAVEFANSLSDDLSTEIALVELFDHPTVKSITSFLAHDKLVGHAPLVDNVPQSEAQHPRPWLENSSICWNTIRASRKLT